MENIFTLKVKDAVAKGQALADDIWQYKHPGEPIQAEDSEYLSWVNSTPRFLKVAMDAGLGELDAIFEMPTPGGGYIDVVLAGKDANNSMQARLLLVELKQWSDQKFEQLDTKDYVRITVGGESSDRKHPVLQLVEYMASLKNNHYGIFKKTEKNRISISALAYLHNMKDTKELMAGVYNYWANVGVEVYCQGEEEKMQEYIGQIFHGYTSSQPLLHVVNDCGYIMSKPDFDGIQKAMDGWENAQMVEDQKPIVEEVKEHLRQQVRNPHNEIIVISGGPGTGKTIIGMHFLYDYAKMFGVDKAIEDACFCLPRSATVREVINYKFRVNTYRSSGIVPFLKDVRSPHKLIVIDEAHRMEDLNDLERIFKNSNQTMVIILQDDHQLIRPKEIGTLEKFQAFADAGKIPLTPMELNVQKRCVNLGNLLVGLEKLFYNENIGGDIKLPSVTVFNDLNHLDRWIQKMAKNSKAKILAPYCWDWPKPHDGNRVDINIGDFHKKWNPGDLKEQAKALNEEENADTEHVYCIYTTQGLDLDNVAFIWWNDLRWDEKNNCWVVSLDANKDYKFKEGVREANLKENDSKLIMLFKDMYYVLLSRARENLGIWFRDAATKKHVCEVLGLTPET